MLPDYLFVLKVQDAIGFGEQDRRNCVRLQWSLPASEASVSEHCWVNCCLLLVIDAVNLPLAHVPIFF